MYCSVVLYRKLVMTGWPVAFYTLPQDSSQKRAPFPGLRMELVSVVLVYETCVMWCSLLSAENGNNGQGIISSQAFHTGTASIPSFVCDFIKKRYLIVIFTTLPGQRQEYTGIFHHSIKENNFFPSSFVLIQGMWEKRTERKKLTESVRGAGIQ